MKRGLGKLIKKQRAYYKSIVSVFCPILQDTVFFTSEGFNHLLYKTYHKPRKLSERFMKLKCLDYATEVLANCNVILKTRESQGKIKEKYKKIIWHELVYEVKKGTKVRVIVEKRGSGKNTFLSIMPHDKRSKPKKRPKERF